MPIQLTIQKKLQREEAVKVEDVEHAEDSDVEDAAQGANESSKQSKSEKKSRKAMLKLGMKPISITSLSRVTIKRTKNAAQQFRMPDFGSVMAKSDISAAVAGAQGDEEPRDIDLVITQAGLSKGKAVKALKTYNGDIVAIMELTT